MLRIDHDATHRGFEILFYVMIVNLLITSLDIHGQWNIVLSQVTTTLIFLSAMYLVSHSKRWLLILGFTTLPAVVNNWLLELLDLNWLVTINNLLFVLSHVTVTVFLVGALAHSTRVNKPTIYAAMCVYLMIAQTFTYLYLSVEAAMPGSFSFMVDDNGLVIEESYRIIKQTLEYFSYVTLTTLGFGDIAPVRSFARALVTLEAVMGQLYLTIVLARLVAVYLKESEQN